MFWWKGVHPATIRSAPPQKWMKLSGMIELSIIFQNICSFFNLVIWERECRGSKSKPPMLHNFWTKRDIDVNFAPKDAYFKDLSIDVLQCLVQKYLTLFLHFVLLLKFPKIRFLSLKNRRNEGIWTKNYGGHIWFENFEKLMSKINSATQKTRFHQVSMNFIDYWWSNKFFCRIESRNPIFGLDLKLCAVITLERNVSRHRGLRHLKAYKISFLHRSFLFRFLRCAYFSNSKNSFLKISKIEKMAKMGSNIF